LTFNFPVCVKSPPGETNRLFIVERTGRILVVTNLVAPTKTVFLDLSTTTYSAYLEAGLLGLAFHPGFATNHYLYAFRTMFATTPGATNLIHDVLSRFEANEAQIMDGLIRKVIRKVLPVGRPPGQPIYRPFTCTVTDTARWKAGLLSGAWCIMAPCLPS